MKCWLVLLLLISFDSYSQVEISFVPLWGGKRLELQDTLSINDQAQIRFDTFRFYISDVAFYQDSVLVFSDPEKAHLLDLESDSTLFLQFPDLSNSPYNKIAFRFGIDSLTNVSGAMSGDLDPMYGMYWSWQSGYINCKLEGAIIDQRSSNFQLHLGGYLPPFDASSMVILSCCNSNKLSLDLKNFFQNSIAEKTGLNIMSPCSAAAGISNQLANSFYFTK